MRYGIVVVVGLGVLVSGVATATPVDADPDVACNDRSDEVIGMLPNGEVKDGEVRLYPGSTLNLVLCTDGYALTTGAWSLEESIGLAGVEESEDRKSYTVTVNSQKSNVSVAQLVTNRTDVSGLVIRLQSGGIVEQEFADGTIVSFPNGSMRTEFRQEKNRYLRTEARLEENVTAVRNTTADLGASEGSLDEASLEDVNDSRSVVRNISRDWERLDNGHASGLTRLLYDAVWEDRDSTGELRTFRGVLDRTRQTESNVTTALNGYLRALERTEQRLLRSVLVDVGIGFLPGLLVGGLLGAWYPHREAKRVAYDRQYSAVDYGWRTLLVPLVAGLFVCVATLVILGLVDVQWFGYLWEVLS